MTDVEVIRELERTFRAAIDRDDADLARRRLLDAGWLDALATDSAAAVQVVFRIQGERGRDVGCLDDVVARALAPRCEAAGGTDVAVAYPLPDPLSPAGSRHDGPHHVVFGPRRTAAALVWPTVENGAVSGLEIIDTPEGITGAATVSGIDPVLGLLALDKPPSGSRLDQISGEEARAAWEAGAEAGRLALAHQLVGCSQALLGLATEYALGRSQFSVKIATFQAVRHRLAEVKVALEAATAATVVAGELPTWTSTALAKALAGRGAALAGRNCLQVFGGIGFTAEHPFHTYFRRLLVLDALLGNQRGLERAVGAAVVAGTPVRRLVELDQVPPAGLSPGST